MSDQIIYKVWRKGRFASFTFFDNAGKITIDIGQFDGNNKLLNSVVVYVDPIQFLTYLHAEVTANVKKLYPKFAEQGYQVFGGKNGLARVFKSQFKINDDQTVDASIRIFKAAHYKGKTTAAGAIMPTSDLISMESIHMSAVELTELYHSLSIFLYTGSVPKPAVERGVNPEDDSE